MLTPTENWTYGWGQWWANLTVAMQFNWYWLVLWGANHPWQANTPTMNFIDEDFLGLQSYFTIMRTESLSMETHFTLYQICPIHELFFCSFQAGCLPWMLITTNRPPQLVLIVTDHSQVFPIKLKLTHIERVIASNNFSWNKLSTSLYTVSTSSIVSQLVVTVKICHNDGSRSHRQFLMSARGWVAFYGNAAELSSLSLRVG